LGADSIGQESIIESISNAKNLQTLRLHVQWIPNTHSSSKPDKFTLQDARDLMLREEHLQLRVIAFGDTLYTVGLRKLPVGDAAEILCFQGKWVLRESPEDGQESDLEFQVLADVAEDKWQI
jgi:hypothetical protein